MGLNFSDECRSRNSEELKVCRRNLVEGVTDFTLQFVLTNHGSFEAMVGPISGQVTSLGQEDLTDLGLFTRHPFFRAVTNRMINQVKDETENKSRLAHLQETILPRVQDELVKQIDLKVADPRARQLMRDKILAIRWSAQSCGKKRPGNYFESFCSASILQPHSQHQRGWTPPPTSKSILS